MVDQKQLELIRANLSKVNIPTAASKVHKDECVYCFHTQESEGGLNVCLNTFLGACIKHTPLLASKNGNNLFLNFKKFKVPKKADQQREGKPNAEIGSPPKKKEKPTVLGINVEGGVNLLPTEQEFEVVNSLVCLPDITVPLPDADLPEKIQMAIAGIIAHTPASRADDIKAWEREKVQESVLARDLVQDTPAPKIPRTGWCCHKCDLKENLWLCLTCGAISCSRKNWDGTGGNNHGVEHYEATYHPLAVKLGTITAEGTADVYSYPEDNMVEDPLLKQHLEHFGINISEMKKTEKSIAEMELDQNLSFDFARIEEKGVKLQPISGPGHTGFENIGNSCYLASVMQMVFTIPEFQKRFTSDVEQIFRSSTKDPTTCFHTQMSKLGHGILSGQYAITKSSDTSADEDRTEQVGIPPRMFKSVIGKGHPEFETMRQQDALEFFQHLMETVERQERAMSPSEANDVSKHFKFRVEEKVVDTKSSMVKYMYRDDNVMPLSIPIEKAINKDEVAAYEEKQKGMTEEEKKKSKQDPVRPIVPLSACLETYTQPEVIEGFYSTALKEKTTALKTAKLATFPDYLVLHMKRFVLDGWVPKKLDVFIDVQDEIDISSMRGTGLQPGEKELPEEEEDQPAELQIDQNIVNQLVEMGFPLIRAQKAAMHTKNAEQAMEWVFAHSEDPDIDAPIQQQKKSSGNKSGIQVKPEDVATLASMGFTEKQATVALKQTDNNVERAIDWLFSHSDIDVEAMDVDAGAGSNSDSKKKEVKKPDLPDGSGKYRLLGFISHIGTSTQSGHYVCHIRKNGKWVLFNDRKVAISENPPKEMGYLYFYQRV